MCNVYVNLVLLLLYSPAGTTYLSVVGHVLNLDGVT